MKTKRLLQTTLAFSSLIASSVTAVQQPHTTENRLASRQILISKLSMGPGNDQPKEEFQSASGGVARKGGRGRPKRAEGEASEQPEEKNWSKLEPDNQARPQLVCIFAPPRVPLKSLMEAEMKLVYGDKEQDITQKLSKSPASSSASLSTCQTSEIVCPESGPNPSFLPQIDKWLHVALKDADSYYRRKKYVTAASRFTTALELCSKGSVLGKPLDADYEDISKVTSFIESKLAACYLRMRRPNLALPHSHRSIYLNPIRYQNHFQQAMVFRLLGRPRQAARSAMIADLVYWLSGGTEQRISNLIKLYWQAMLEQAITSEHSFSVMYTPCTENTTEDRIEKVKEMFQSQYPEHAQYLFTDPSGSHLLPQTTSWLDPCMQRYTLTLGFRKSEDGSFLDKLTTRKCPIFTGSRPPFAPLSTEDIERMNNSLERRILPVLDFIKCTKLAVGFSAGSGLMERLQYADYLGQLGRTTEQGLALQQTLAELAIAPYLQEISHADTQLLQALMVDSMDTLEGKRTDKERVWNEMQKVGLLEELAHQQEESYLRERVPKSGRKSRGRKRKPPHTISQGSTATQTSTSQAWRPGPAEACV